MPVLAALLAAAPALAPAEPLPAPVAEASNEDSAALPDPVRAVIEEAIASGDASAVAAVVRFAIAAHPAAEDEIKALHDGFRARLAERQEAEAAERRQQLARASFLENWDGNVELGASVSTGSTDNLGLFAAVRAQRGGIDWSHRFAARAEIQETNGKRTVERMSAEWQPRMQLGNRFYGFGIAQAERDPFAGIDSRYTLGGGAGYTLVGGNGVKLELEGGATLRHADLTDGTQRAGIAGRASADFTWRLSDTLSLRQTGAIFFEQGNGSGTALTALDASVLGPLRLRLSHELRFENNRVQQRDATSTTSRATFVYDF